MFDTQVILSAVLVTHMPGSTVSVQVQQALSCKGVIDRIIIIFKDKVLYHSTRSYLNQQKH